MTVPTERNATSRRVALAKARQSRRPSRLGMKAGAAVKPDYLLEDDAGFPGLLKRVWQVATAAPDLTGSVNTLLTLDGHVDIDIQLRGLRVAEEAALKVLCGVSWREDCQRSPVCRNGERPAFLGEIGLTTSGRVVIRVPSQRPLASEEDLVDGVIHVPWSAQAITDYQGEAGRAAARYSSTVADCRAWLAAAGAPGRDGLLELLKDAARRNAPFVLYQEDRQYTNFRDRNTLTGKTLWPGHPDCALSALHALPLELWSDNDAVMVVCLGLLVRSAGYARIEEANGTQLTVDHIAHLLERTRRNYNQVPGGREIPPAASSRVEALDALAAAIADRRGELTKTVQLYREIHGPLMHKIERIAGPHAVASAQREEALCARLRERLPVSGATLDELAASIAASPSWLAEPHGEFGTGLESVVFETVSAAAEAFEADFAMSRGMRSIPTLVQALREQDWALITQWEVPDYFCCVVPVPAARRYFGDSSLQLADTAWAISSRMQYNSWHFIAGNIPKVPVVVARDHFVPPTIPDIAFYSDQHHHGHVASHVRFSIRSPQAIEILGRRFNGFIDLRLLRCAGQPFDEQDLLATHRGSAFIAKATSLAADLVAAGTDIEVTSFDSNWHRASIVPAAALGTS
jgi:hypothetical protein